MREWQSQSHVRWYCRYHVVWVPKYRKRAIFGEMRRGIGRIVRELCQRQGVEWGRRARAVGSRACVVGHPAEVQRGEHGGVSERAVGDPHPSGVSGAATQLHGLPLLGRAGTASARSVWPKRSSATTSGSRKQRKRNKRSWNSANRRPLRGAFIIPPPQGAVADSRTPGASVAGANSSV